MTNSKMLDALVFTWVLATTTVCVGCHRDAATTTVARPRPPVPLATMPVVCSELPQGREVAVTCQYYFREQYQEAWDRSVERAAMVAVSLGLSHVQYLHSIGGVDAVPSRSAVECQRVWSWQTKYRCEGGETSYSYRSSYATTHFALLTADEAAARGNDPLVPPERRPIDARQLLTERGFGAPSSAPGSNEPAGTDLTRSQQNGAPGRD